MKPNDPFTMRLDWSDLKAETLKLLNGNAESFKLAANRKLALDTVNSPNVSWTGWSSGQLQRWLTVGYESDSIKGLEDFIPPIREKRKFVFGEEGDEFHYDLAASGDDNYMSHFTKRDEIPGLAIEAHISFISDTNPKVISDYNRWLCRVMFACESAGIDTEVSLTTEAVRMWPNTSKPVLTKIRVKQENEATDFLSWSAMISPAAMRGLIFVARILHSDANGKRCKDSMGSSNTGKNRTWSVKFDLESRTLKVDCPYNPRNFPEADMQSQLREALREASNAAT
jgi:hypothetical protein